MLLKLFLALLSFCSILYSSEYDLYFEEAGHHFDINPKLLKAIAATESMYNPKAIHTNKNKTQDIGLMQINTVHLPELLQYKISKEDLFNPKINIFIGALILKRCLVKHNASHKALNCYNGKISNNDYYLKVLTNYFNIQ